MPQYIGYAQSGNNAPTLFFDTGFLVQAGSNAVPAGWYGFRNVYRYGANMDADGYSGLAGLNGFIASWDAINQRVMRQMISQNCMRASGHVPPAGNTVYVLIDTPDLDIPIQASFYQFSGPLMRPGDPGFQANIDAAHAMATLGALTPAGAPAHHPVVPTAPGITSFR